MGGFTAGGQVIFGTPTAKGIESCPTTGGEPRSLTAFQPGLQERWHVYPVLLPDQKHFLFGRVAGAETGIYLGSLDGNPEVQTKHRILVGSTRAVFAPDPATNPDQGYLMFLQDGTLWAQRFDPRKAALSGEATPVVSDAVISFTATADGKLGYVAADSATNLVLIDRAGHKIDGAKPIDFRYGNMCFSPDGRLLATAHSTTGSTVGVFVTDLEHSSEVRITSGSTPVWSPDGKRIAFASSHDAAGKPCNRCVADNLYLRSADAGGTDELLLATPEIKAPLDWSKDGRFLLFSVFSSTNDYDVWVLPMDGDKPGRPVPYLETPAPEQDARFSPDGRFVAYTFSGTTGGIYVRPFDPADPTSSGKGAGAVRVSGGTAPRWRADGKEILYTSSHQLWSVDISTKPTFHAGAPKLLCDIPDGNFAATPDAQRFLFDVPTGKPSAKIILNWQAGLKP